MQSTIVQLKTIAAILRGFHNTEPEAPRLITEYLEVVPCKALADLETDHAAAMAALSQDWDDERLNSEKFESARDKIANAYEDYISETNDKIDDLNHQIALLSERSDSPAPAATADASMIEALQTSLFVERAKVKQLEARLAATPPVVKPLDAKPAAATKARGKIDLTKHATAPPVLTLNAERGGIELRFNGKPDEATLAALTAAKWRWAARQPGTPWYAKHTEEQYLFAQSLATGSSYTPMPVWPEPEPAAAIPQDAPAPRSRTIITPNF